MLSIIGVDWFVCLIACLLAGLFVCEVTPNFMPRTLQLMVFLNSDKIINPFLVRRGTDRWNLTEHSVCVTQLTSIMVTALVCQLFNPRLQPHWSRISRPIQVQHHPTHNLTPKANPNPNHTIPHPSSTTPIDDVYCCAEFFEQMMPL